MRIRWIACITCVWLGSIVSSVAKESLSLEHILSGKYSPKGIKGSTPSIDGVHYFQTDDQRTAIVRYSYATGKVVDTLFSVHKALDCPFKQFQGFEFSPDEKAILFYTDREQIYRRTFKANYYIYELSRNRVIPLSEGGKQMSPSFSPNGRMIAFARDNNLFLVQMDFNYAERALTKDGKLNEIINGMPDWVYEEELALDRFYTWSGDNSHILFVRTDESRVKRFSFDLFKGLAPERKEFTLYSGSYVFKYPKAGEENAQVKLLSYNIATKITKEMKLDVKPDDYIALIKPSHNPEETAVFTLNRNQNELKLQLCNPRSSLTKTIVNVKAKYYFDEKTFQSTLFFPDCILILDDRSGYRHIYKYATNGILLKQITRGNWEVTDLFGMDAKSGKIYFESTVNGPTVRDAYSIDLKGKMTRLTSKEGFNRVTFNPSFSYFTLQHSSHQSMPSYTVHTVDGKQLRVLEDNKSAMSKLAAFDYPRREPMTVKTKDGTILNGWIIKPLDFDPNKKYPVFMEQYSGPGSQTVQNRWSLGFQEYFATQGYIVVAVDGRGTGARGREFQKGAYPTLGVREALDQAEAAQHLGTLPYVDKSRIAIYGWSFGGYNTLMALSLGNGVFKAGVAVAPVTDFKFYDTIYTERFLKTPQENADGYEKSSPLAMADRLQGNLLIVHGSADDNVHYQNTAEYLEALVQANKQFEMQVYTNRDHNISGGNSRLHLYNRMLKFLSVNL